LTSCAKDVKGVDSVIQCDASGGVATVVQVCAAPTFCSGGACVVCKPGSSLCEGGKLATCTADGSGYDAKPCPNATPICVGAACKLCQPNEVFCRPESDDDPAAVMTCGPKGDTAAAIKACGAGQVCHNNACKACVPSGAICIGNTPLICAADGASASIGSSCTKEGLICGSSGCGCGQGGDVKNGPYCAPSPVGLAASQGIWFCDAGGKNGKKAGDCTEKQICIAGKCTVCKPGAKRCKGNKAEFCMASGQAWQLAQDCDASAKGVTTCSAGTCTDTCAIKDGNTTNIGCRFWAADLDNAKITSGGSTFDAQNAPFGVALVNVGKKSATVTITYGPGPAVPVAKTTKLTLSAGAAKTVVLPLPAWKVKQASLDGTSVQGIAFRIDSTAPIAAFQHNPLQANAFSADASLLLPANALGTTYRVMARKQSVTALRAYVAIVATRPGTTHVNITTTSATLAGDLIPALKPGDVYKINVQQGQILNLETAQVGDELTGTKIVANKAVAVFAGAEAAHAPDNDTCVLKSDGAGKVCAGTIKSCAVAGDCAQICCADHIEEQLFPLSAWGQSYIAGQLQARGNEPSVWRIVAGHNGTRVLFTPAIAPVKHLQAGEWFEVFGNKDVVIEANKPILVGQFMASSGLTGKGLGDPAFILLPPVESMGRTARFWVPSTYGTNFISVASASDSALQVDGKKPAKGVAIGDSGWSIWRLPVSSGVHEITSTAPFSALLHGWSKDGSYGHSVGHGVR